MLERERAREVGKYNKMNGSEKCWWVVDVGDERAREVGKYNKMNES
ncbi:hypothetical protein ES703_114178 [subsurface metagenome]